MRAADAVEGEVNPPRVDNVERYWTEPPPTRSARCLMWESKIRGGWRPGRRINRLDYYSAAQWYGVYLWEYLNVISPLVDELTWR